MAGNDGNPEVSYLSSSPQPGSPGRPPLSPNYGYQNNSPRPSSSSRPHSSHLKPNPVHGNYQSAPPPSSYQQDYPGSQQSPYGAPQGLGFQQPPYSQTPIQGTYEQGLPPPNWVQGPPSFQASPPQPFYPGYGGYQQGGAPPQPPYYGGGAYPPGGGYGGY
jgi:hypothetical protein